jgi:ribokinase
VDFFEPNEEELKQLSGETTVQSAIRRVKPRFQGVLAVKLGWKGSRIVEPSEEGRYIPSFPTRVADTTAAGDVFDAAFISGIVKSHDLRLCAKMGKAAASIAISRRGKTSLRFPKLSEVQSLIDHG